MNMKNFVLAGIAGGITDFLLGWVLYGIVFYDFFGGGEPNMAMITGGCFSFGFLMSYILVGLAGISGFSKGARAGAGIGILTGLMSNFFMRGMDAQPNWQQFGVDLIICVIIGALVGGVVGAVNGKLSKTSEA